MSTNKNTQTASTSTRILQISDFHLFSESDKELLGVNTYDALKNVVKYIEAHEDTFDLILASGDVSQDGSVQSYEHAQQLLAPLKSSVVYLPGNHDHLPAMQQVLSAQMDPIYSVGGWLVISLDTHVAGTNEGYLEDSQLQLLEKAAASNQNILVVMHHNPVPMGSAWLDPMMIANATQLLSICEHHSCIRGLVWGHVHQEMDSVWVLGRERRQLRLLACPATCLQFAPHSQQFELDSQPPGYRVIELGAQGVINTRVVRVPNLDIKPQLDSTGY
ncbi:MAG TPA: 3',5'-cyclic-AMP phosphodiesterase [Paenalcaligenes sp.]|nr:3',5'-cyclic-AMP phosphodiesterase [Paenalcaligenes sp.]